MSELPHSKTIAGTLLASTITLLSAPAWACGPAFEPMRGPEEFLFWWFVFSLLVGWLGSIWTFGTLFTFRERLGGWRLFGITLLGTPALGLIATLIMGLIIAVDLGGDSNTVFWGGVAIGMTAVYQTGFSLGAYRLFRKRDA